MVSVFKYFFAFMNLYKVWTAVVRGPRSVVCRPWSAKIRVYCSDVFRILENTLNILQL